MEEASELPGGHRLAGSWTRLPAWKQPTFLKGCSRNVTRWALPPPLPQKSAGGRYAKDTDRVYLAERLLHDPKIDDVVERSVSQSPGSRLSCRWAMSRRVTRPAPAGVGPLFRKEWGMVMRPRTSLLVHSLELEPLARSLARVVEPRRTLGDHAGQQERVVPGLHKWLVPGLDCAASPRHFGGRIRARIRSNKSR
jgi:hypothetical protein